MTTTEAPKASFQIFRASNAPGLMDGKFMDIEPYTELQSAGLEQLLANGYGDGGETRVVTSLPGFSLTHVWFKKGYPLPLHTHDVDCMYYIIAGLLRLGTQELGARDCFFVPAGVPYTYRPGPDGVEVLEIRHETHFNFVNLGRGQGYWTSAAETCAANHDDWVVARPPSEKPVGPAAS